MEARTVWVRRASGSGFIAGLVAGVIASGVMLLLNATTGGLSLPQELGSELLALMPPPAFAFFHQLLGANAKYDFFIVVLLGQCAVFALGGALYNRYANRQNHPLRWAQGLLLGLILWLVAGLLLLPLTGSGVFGANLTVGLEGGMLSLALVGLIFAFLFVFAQRWIVASQSGETSATSEREIDELEKPTRRALFKQGAVVLGLAVVGVGAWKFISQGVGGASVPVARLLQSYRSKITPPPVPNYGTIVAQPMLSPEVTSNDQYYVVSKNLTDPTVNAQSWSLKVTGQVEQPYTLSYQELLALPMQQQYESMECISNDVGGSYMSNALWEGVRLSDLLQRAGVKPGASKVILHAYDDYADSIHLSKALEPTTLVAVRMNNVTLPNGHGFPARLLVPGIYGMKHVKWLTQIEVVNYDFHGYWQQRGWSDPAPVRLTSRIDTPLDGSNVHARQTGYIAGVAFAGNQGISEVDVSLDAGKTWQPATLKRPLSPLTWVLWEISWQPKPGQYTVVVRAVDLQG
ncbi:MAG TPA: molybdopterin-dependent oxidoreductase, partial [Ktedonobacteraceae bacterium]|nr:molybdopterin-dependent oxidoreductase [Ktedonobacteraceae bacterium]